MCYWKKHRKDTQQKIAPIVVWPLVPRKAGREWERNAALVDTQERFISKPVTKITAQTPARARCLWKANAAGAGDASVTVVCGAAAGEQDRDLRHHLKLGANCEKRRGSGTADGGVGSASVRGEVRTVGWVRCPLLFPARQRSPQAPSGVWNTRAEGLLRPGLATLHLCLDVPVSFSHPNNRVLHPPFNCFGPFGVTRCFRGLFWLAGSACEISLEEP